MSKRELKNCTLCGQDYLSWRPTQSFCGKSCAATGSNGNSYRHGNARKYGMSPTYKVWAGMVKRIRNPDEYHRKYYGHLGIDERWLDFVNFLADMGERPGNEYSIDRLNNNRGYYPGNCRWASRQEQMQNTRATKLITYNGVTHCQEEWGRITGIGGLCILKRLKRGWSIERALSTPSGA